MTAKEKILTRLSARTEEYVSGETLAAELGVSRTAVWKAIAALKKEGYPIDAATNRGYRMSRGGDVLTSSGVEALLSDSALSVTAYSSLASTNTLARELAEGGAPEGTAVVSACQTAGRGRGSRSFFSPEGTGVYMSLVLRPRLSVSDGSLITTAAAVAVCRAIEAISGEAAGIKWVNDVFVGGKKVCGILTEAALSVETGGLDFCILGVGINISPPEGGFPPELSDSAGAVFAEGDVPENVRNRLAAAVLDGFMALYRDIYSNEIFEEYRRRLFILGRTVTVLRGGSERPAVVTGLDRSFNLRVRYENGTEDVLSSGEVSLRV